MEFIGLWRSKDYTGVCGSFILCIPSKELSESFNKCQLDILYDSKSPYRADDHITIILEGKYGKLTNHRIMLRQEKLEIDQYFILTMSSIDKIKWRGYMTCILPVDLVQLYSVVMKNINDIEIDNNDNDNNSKEKIVISI